MRVGVACVMQESNSFAPRCSTLENFSIEIGPAIVAANHRTNTEIGGFLEELECLKLEAVPLISAWGLEAGPVEDGAFDRLAPLLCDEGGKGSLAGLFFVLHGAWTSVCFFFALPGAVWRCFDRDGHVAALV